MRKIYYFPEDDILFEKVDMEAGRAASASASSSSSSSSSIMRRAVFFGSMVEAFQNFLEAHDPFFIWLSGTQQKHQYIDEVLLERFLQLKPNCRFLYRQEGKLCMYDYLTEKKDREKMTKEIMRLFHHGFGIDLSNNDRVVENTVNELDVVSLSLTVNFFRDQGILEDVLRTDKRFIKILKGVLQRRVVGSKLQSGYYDDHGLDILRAVISISVPCTFAFLQQHYQMIMFGEPLPPSTSPFTIISEAAFGISLSYSTVDDDDDDDNDNEER